MFYAVFRMDGALRHAFQAHFVDPHVIQQLEVAGATLSDLSTMDHSELADLGVASLVQRRRVLAAVSELVAMRQEDQLKETATFDAKLGLTSSMGPTSPEKTAPKSENDAAVEFKSPDRKAPRETYLRRHSLALDAAKRLGRSLKMKQVDADGARVAFEEVQRSDPLVAAAPLATAEALLGALGTPAMLLAVTMRTTTSASAAIPISELLAATLRYAWAHFALAATLRRHHEEAEQSLAANRRLGKRTFNGCPCEGCTAVFEQLTIKKPRSVAAVREQWKENAKQTATKMLKQVKGLIVDTPSPNSGRVDAFVERSLLELTTLLTLISSSSDTPSAIPLTEDVPPSQSLVELLSETGVVAASVAYSWAPSFATSEAKRGVEGHVKRCREALGDINAWAMEQGLHEVIEEGERDENDERDRDSAAVVVDALDEEELESSHEWWFTALVRRALASHRDGSSSIDVANVLAVCRCLGVVESEQKQLDGHGGLSSASSASTALPLLFAALHTAMHFERGSVKQEEEDDQNDGHVEDDAVLSLTHGQRTALIQLAIVDSVSEAFAHLDVAADGPAMLAALYGSVATHGESTAATTTMRVGLQHLLEYGDANVQASLAPSIDRCNPPRLLRSAAVALAWELFTRIGHSGGSTAPSRGVTPEPVIPQRPPSALIEMQGSRPQSRCAARLGAYRSASSASTQNDGRSTSMMVVTDRASLVAAVGRLLVGRLLLETTTDGFPFSVTDTHGNVDEEVSGAPRWHPILQVMTPTHVAVATDRIRVLGAYLLTLRAAHVGFDELPVEMPSNVLRSSLPVVPEEPDALWQQVEHFGELWTQMTSRLRTIALIPHAVAVMTPLVDAMDNIDSLLRRLALMSGDTTVMNAHPTRRELRTLAASPKVDFATRLDYVTRSMAHIRYEERQARVTRRRSLLPHAAECGPDQIEAQSRPTTPRKRSTEEDGHEQHGTSTFRIFARDALGAAIRNIPNEVVKRLLQDGPVKTAMEGLGRVMLPPQHGTPSVLVLEAAPGGGKSTLLESIEHTLWAAATEAAAGALSAAADVGAELQAQSQQAGTPLKRPASAAGSRPQSPAAAGSGSASPKARKRGGGRKRKDKTKPKNPDEPKRRRPLALLPKPPKIPPRETVLIPLRFSLREELVLMGTTADGASGAVGGGFSTQAVVSGLRQLVTRRLAEIGFDAGAVAVLQAGGSVNPSAAAHSDDDSSDGEQHTGDSWLQREPALAKALRRCVPCRLVVLLDDADVLLDTLASAQGWAGTVRAAAQSIFTALPELHQFLGCSVIATTTCSSSGHDGDAAALLRYAPPFDDTAVPPTIKPTSSSTSRAPLPPSSRSASFTAGPSLGSSTAATMPEVDLRAVAKWTICTNGATVAEKIPIDSQLVPTSPFEHHVLAWGKDQSNVLEASWCDLMFEYAKSLCDSHAKRLLASHIESAKACEEDEVQLTLAATVLEHVSTLAVHLVVSELRSAGSDEQPPSEASVALPGECAATASQLQELGLCDGDAHLLRPEGLLVEVRDPASRTLLSVRFTSMHLAVALAVHGDPHALLESAILTRAQNNREQRLPADRVAECVLNYIKDRARHSRDWQEQLKEVVKVSVRPQEPEEDAPPAPGPDSPLAANAFSVLAGVVPLWRQEDLRGVRIAGADFGTATFWRCDFSDADLSGCDTTKCTLLGCEGVLPPASEQLGPAEGREGDEVVGAVRVGRVDGAAVLSAVASPCGSMIAIARHDNMIDVFSTVSRNAHPFCCLRLEESEEAQQPTRSPSPSQSVGASPPPAANRVDGEGRSGGASPLQADTTMVPQLRSSAVELPQEGHSPPTDVASTPLGFSAVGDPSQTPDQVSLSNTGRSSAATGMFNSNAAGVGRSETLSAEPSVNERRSPHAAARIARLTFGPCGDTTLYAFLTDGRVLIWSLPEITTKQQKEAINLTMDASPSFLPLSSYAEASTTSTINTFQAFQSSTTGRADSSSGAPSHCLPGRLVKLAVAGNGAAEDSIEASQLSGYSTAHSVHQFREAAAEDGDVVDDADPFPYDASVPVVVSSVNRVVRTHRVLPRGAGVQLQHEMAGHRGRIHCIRANVVTGAKLTELQLEGGVSAHLLLIATGAEDETVRIWSGSTGSSILPQPLRHTAPVTIVRWLAAGSTSLLTATKGDPNVRLWDVATGTLKHVLTGHAKRCGINSMEVALGKWCVTAAEDRTVRLWDLKVRSGTDHSVIAPLRLPSGAAAVSFATTAADVALPSERCSWVDGNTAPPIVATAPNGVVKVAVAADWTTLWEPDVNDTAAHGSSSAMATHDSVYVVAQGGSAACSEEGEFSQNSGSPSTASVLRFALAEWCGDLAEGPAIEDMGEATVIASAELVGHDGTQHRSVVAVGTSAGYVQLWDATTGEFLRTVTRHTTNGEGSSVSCLVFQPGSGELLLSSAAGDNADETVRLCDTSTLEEVKGFGGHTMGAYLVSISPGRLPQAPTASKDPTKIGQLAPTRIATCSNDLTVRLLDPETHRVIRHLEGHVARVSALAFSLDGHALCSAGCDSALYVWNSLDGTLMERLEGHASALRCAAFGALSNTDMLRELVLATGSEDGELRCWTMRQPLDGEDPEDVAETIEAASNRVSAVSSPLRASSVVARSAFSSRRPSEAGSQSPLRHIRRPSAPSIAPPKLFTPRVRLNSADTSTSLSRLPPRESKTKAVKRIVTYREFEGHTAAVRCVEFAPYSGSDHLASGSDDGTARIWNARTGATIHSFDPGIPEVPRSLTTTTTSSAAQQQQPLPAPILSVAFRPVEFPMIESATIQRFRILKEATPIGLLGITVGAPPAEEEGVGEENKAVCHASNSVVFVDTKNGRTLGSIPCGSAVDVESAAGTPNLFAFAGFLEQRGNTPSTLTGRLVGVLGNGTVGLWTDETTSADELLAMGMAGKKQTLSAGGSPPAKSAAVGGMTNRITSFAPRLVTQFGAAKDSWCWPCTN